MVVGKRRDVHPLFLALVLATLPLLLLVVALQPASPARARPTQAHWSVCPAGCDFETIQQGIDGVDPGDVLDVVGNHVYTENLIITRSIILQGGCSNASCSVRLPLIYDTIINADGNGRAITIRGTGQVITPIIDGFVVTGGDATGESDHPHWGGGIGCWDAAPILRFNTIVSNVATRDEYEQGHGGGIALWNPGPGTWVRENRVISNTANPLTATRRSAYGGGLAVISGTATIWGNELWGNVANSGEEDGQGYGGGVYVLSATVTLAGNQLRANRAATGDDGYGGGVYLENSNALVADNLLHSNLGSRDDAGRGGGLSARSSQPLTLYNNIITTNTAGLIATSYGGGVFLRDCQAALEGNLVQDNLAARDAYGVGGGIRAWGGEVTLRHNWIVSNSSSIGGSGSGGGINLSSITATLEADTFLFNTATYSLTAGASGHAAYLAPTSRITIVNALIARNGALNGGQGLYLLGTGGPLSLTLVNNTIVSNASRGICCIGPITPTLVNTILWGNGTDLDCQDANITYSDIEDGEPGTGNFSQAPLFVDPAGGDFHLRPGSPCIDRGATPLTYTFVPALDWEGESRPAGNGIDLGVDEFHWQVYLPLMLRNL